MKIALAGNPNSGKTTMFNAITGQNEKVGNWAGVTVDKIEHTVKRSYYSGEDQLVAVDLPGAYSMSPFTSEESVTSSYVLNEAPDVIINIVDASNLGRSLFFTTQLLELGIPIVVALNKSDINAKQQTKIDTSTLSDILGCPVVNTVSITSDGLKELISVAINRVGDNQSAPFKSIKCDSDDKNAVKIADQERYKFVNSIVSRVQIKNRRSREISVTDKIDIVLTNKWLGLPIFAVVIFLVFQISQAWLGPYIADYFVSLIDAFKEWVFSSLSGGNTFLVALLTEGIIGGVSAVVGFLPLVMVMYFLIALLEDCGYMSRVSVILDPIFKKVGLSGKSVIPFVIGTGCAVPGVMACRTIRDERDRRATALLAPFMPCGAKLPVIALFAGAFFKDAPWVGTLMYFLGIIIIFFCALIIKSVTGAKNKSYFIIELPDYKIPDVKRAIVSMLSRGWSYVVKAGTVILLCNAVVFVMQSFDWSFALVDEASADKSILASIARPLSVLFIPIGVKAWQMVAAIITGFIAKENVVGTLAVCYGISNLIDIDNLSIYNGAAGEIANVFGIGSVAALSFMMFNLFSPPCFAAIGAMNAELKSKKWLAAAISLQIAVGYTVAYITYTIGTLIVAPDTLDIIPAIVGASVITVFALVVILLSRKNRLNEGVKWKL